MKRILLVLSFLASFVSNSYAQACATPARVVAVPRADGALVLWTPTGATSFEVQYRVAADSATWVSANVQATGTARDTTTYLQVSGLTACKAYTVRIRAKCSATVTSDWRTYSFKTLGCPVPCTAPRGLFAAVRDSSASLNWASAGTGVTYVVTYKGARDSVSRTVNVTTNSLAIAGLKPCTEYTFKVKVICSTTLASDFSQSASFKTLGCAAPCTTPREVRAIAEGTNKINFFWLGTSTLGYEVQYRIRDSTWSASVRATTLTYKLENTRTCTPYSFRVRAICAQTGTTLLYSEWSGTATVTSAGCAVVPRCDAPRRLSYVPATTTSWVRWDTIAGATYDVQYMGASDRGVWRTISGVRAAFTTLSDLTACSIYIFRVKANCSATSSSNWSAPVRFQTTGCTPICSKPKNLKVFVNDTTAIFSWDRANVTSYKLTIASTDGSFATRTIAVTGFTHTLTGLVRCKTYKVSVTSNCTDGRTSETASTAFTTIGRTCVTNNGNNCKIAGIFTGSANDSTVVEAVATILASAYELQYRKSADTAWSATTSATRPRFVLRGLTRCGKYVLRMRAVCTTGAGEWKTKEFQVGTACFADPNGGDVEYFLGNTGGLKSFEVYPNPGHNALGVSYQLDQDATINVQLVNLQGQVVNQLNGGLQEAGFYNQTLENLDNLHEGLYMLVIRANGKVLATQKWTKQ
ncbi:MAG: fibronectin type III domain-containing protein [Saprospiraceae bacterium]|nr:fibronectin type III domain-containing protein [Saprospiraceae bacterium]